MPKIYIYAILIFLIVGFIKWGHSAVFDQGYNSCQVESTEKIKKAVKAALEKERKTQTEINAGLQRQYDEVNTINDQLNSDLDRLRERPNRASLSEAAKANCKGASGAELAKEHAGFLARYAAKAAKQDTALKACYNHADSVADDP